MANEAEIYSSLTAQLMEKQLRKSSKSQAEAKKESSEKPVKKKRLKGLRKWWRKHAHS